MTELFVAWQDPHDRSWRPVGKLTREDDKFRFVYTKGAVESERFIPFGRMRDLHGEYVSDELFPLFANRIMPNSRPEFESYVQWLGLRRDEADDFSLLARSGGLKKTDSLQTFPMPTRSADERYRVHFFCHGTRLV